MILQTLAYHESGCSRMLTELQNSVGTTTKRLVEMNGENRTNFQQLQQALLASFQTADRLNLERTAQAEAVIRADGALTRGAQRFEGAATRQQLSATGEGMSAIVEAMASRVASGITSVSTGVNDMRTTVEVTRATADATKTDVAVCRETAANTLSAIDALTSKVDMNQKAAARETQGSKDALQNKLQDVRDDLDKTTKAVSDVAELVGKAPTVGHIKAVTDYLVRLEKIVVERGKAIAAVEQDDHGYAKTGAEILRAAKLATTEIKKLDDNIDIMLTAQTEEIAQRTEEALRARFPPGHSAARRRETVQQVTTEMNPQFELVFAELKEQRHQMKEQFATTAKLAEAITLMMARNAQSGAAPAAQDAPRKMSLRASHPETSSMAVPSAGGIAAPRVAAAPPHAGFGTTAPSTASYAGVSAPTAPFAAQYGVPFDGVLGAAPFSGVPAPLQLHHVCRELKRFSSTKHHADVARGTARVASAAVDGAGPQAKSDATHKLMMDARAAVDESLAASDAESTEWAAIRAKWAEAFGGSVRKYSTDEVNAFEKFCKVAFESVEACGIHDGAALMTVCPDLFKALTDVTVLYIAGREESVDNKEASRMRVWAAEEHQSMTIRNTTPVLALFRDAEKKSEKKGGAAGASQ